MNIYSAVKRLGAPFEIGEPGAGDALPLAAHGMIGDGHTAALVRADGCIDWLCLPAFDNPSVFGRLLDRKRGGHTTLQPTAPFQSVQRYDPDTNVLETLFDARGEGLVRVTDFMPWSDDARASVHEVHRRAECFEQSVELVITFDPRFDYGRESPRLERHEHGLLAVGGDGSTLAAVLSHEAEWAPAPDGGLQTRIQLKPGDRLWCVLSWHAERPERIAAYRPYECLRYTRAFWREWTRQLSYEGPWRDYVVRSALALKLMIFGPTGAMVAAPTCSLPEWLGGERNWDYRFTWTRDAALGIRATNLIGCRQEAREFFHFMRDVLQVNEHGPEIMYSIHGGRVPDEQVLAHLSGFQDSRPVRIGNGARDQQQFDTPGYLLDAAHTYESTGGSLSLRTWRMLRRVVDQASAQSALPDHGIWEPRSGVRHNLHSKLMSWVALDRGRRIAPLFGDNDRVGPWLRRADQLREEILTRGLDPTCTRYVSSYDSNEVDATLLLLPSYGLLKPRDPRVAATRDHVVRELGHNGFLYRYRGDDGVAGEEGAFVLCGFWLAEALAQAGEVSAAEEVFVRHAEASNQLGLLAEEIDPNNNTLLGNFPQAFSHMGLINAAARLDAAMRLRDKHSGRVPRLPVDVL